MKLRAILDGLMYKDKVDVYRFLPVTAADGSDDYAEEKVHEALPCKLSQYGKDIAMRQTARAANVAIDLRLCLSPKYEIRENDRLEVTHQGQTFPLYAGVPFRYATHQEISVRREREAKQDGTCRDRRAFSGTDAH